MSSTKIVEIRILRPGCEIVWAGKQFRIIEETPESRVLECLINRVRRTEKLEDLIIEIEVGRIISRGGVEYTGEKKKAILLKDALIGTASTAAKKRLLDLKDWIQALAASGVREFTPNANLKTLVKDLLSTHTPKLEPISVWTLYRAEMKLRKSGSDYTKLLPDYAARGSRKTREVNNLNEDEKSTTCDIRIHPVSANLLLELLDFRRNDESTSLETRAVFKEYKKRVDDYNQLIPLEKNIPVASTMTVTRWIKKSFTSYELDLRRLGKKAANIQYRHTGARMCAETILECVQFDDTDSRVFLIDEETGLPWGTANMCIGVDEYSKSLMGFDFGAGALNTSRELTTFFMSMRHKDMSDPILRLCEKQWLMMGISGYAIFDNASYNASQIFKLTMLENNVDYAYARPKVPTDKSAIEHLNRVFKHDFCAKQRGAAINKNDRDAAKKGMKEAEMTLLEFSIKAAKWLVDEYQNARNDSGLSPNEAWLEKLEFTDLEIPSLEHAWFQSHWMVDKLKMRASGGLQRKGLRYQSDELDKLRRRIGASANLIVRLNPNDLRAFRVLDPQEKCWLHVPCIEDEYILRGLTDSRLSRLERHKRERKYGKPEGTAWMSNATCELMDMSEKLSHSRLLTERGDAYRIRQLFNQQKTIPSLTKNSNKTQNIAITECQIETKVNIFDKSSTAHPMQKKLDPFMMLMRKALE